MYILLTMLRLRQSSPRACWLVGHRGAMGHAPENTMASFRKAREMGSEFVECDVHISKDGKCIVIHDESVERTTDGQGLIRDLTLSQIRKLDAGSWAAKEFKGERVPTLQDLLLWAKLHTSRRGFQMGIAIEIKNEPVRYDRIEERVIKAVEDCGMESRVILISFDHGVVKRAKAVNSKISAGILYNRSIEDPLRRARELGADALFPRRHLVTKDLVRKAHARGLAVATWTVNDPREMRKLLSYKIDAIASNYPDRLNRILESRSTL